MIHSQNLPGSLTLKTEATPASPPTFAAQCPAACDQCRKWKKAPVVLRSKKMLWKSGIWKIFLSLSLA